MGLQISPSWSTDPAAKTLGDAREIFFISVLVVLEHKYGKEPKSGNYNLHTLLVIAFDILISIHARTHFSANSKSGCGRNTRWKPLSFQ